MRYYETERECIDYFREEYFFLSNFYPAVIRYDGIIYLNAEAAFQAQKCADIAGRLHFAMLSPDEAKRLGRKVELRADWDDVKIPVMKEIVREKGKSLGDHFNGIERLFRKERSSGYRFVRKYRV